jgi:ATP-dependent DNA helicase RecG
MASAPTAAGAATSPLPPALERLRKVLVHERRTALQDRAAVGGLERFVRQAAAAEPPESPARPWLVKAVAALAGYGAWPPERRRQVVAALLLELASRQDLAHPPTRSGAAPVAPASPAPRPPIPTGQDGRTTEGRVAASRRPAPEAAGRGRHGAATAERAAGGAVQGRASASLVAPGRPLPSLSPNAPVGDLPGVGPKAVAALARLGIHRVRDLLYHLPRRHLDRRSISRIADLVPGQVATVYGTVWQVQTKRSPLQHLVITEAIIKDESGFCHAVWFNQPYLVRTLSRPGEVVFSGKVEYGYGGGLQLTSPEFEFDTGDLLHTARLVPFYPKTEGITDKQLRLWVRRALDATAGALADPVPAPVLAAEGLLELGQALRQAHFPDDDELRAQAFRRLAFDEFLLIQLGVLRRRREWQESQPGVALQAPPGLMEEFAARLPFQLTGAQRRAIREILADMARPVPMSRLLQGEVGSGKTVVAAAACLVAARNGYQAAVMAPTEVLAQQHHRTLSELLAPFGLRVELVTGSLRKKEKAAVWEACRVGGVDVLVGTHALIQDEGEFAQLGLVIVDEQHRFGVRQRGALRRKGYNPDVLVMTATPIPRTLALSVYGDLDLSVLDELPPGRRQIKTFLVHPDKRAGAYDFLRRQVRAGRQAFIICPLIDDSDKIEARSARLEFERLQRQFPDLRLGLLHGRMPPREKETIMAAFRDGALDVLVSTAVVEVGIDVPNATVMMIEGADRFGLAQLHQFRGRVGRGEHQSYCLLLSDAEHAPTNERLQVVVNTHDGFALAEEDLRLRGPGEFFGTRQSGLPDLKVARLSDVAVLEAARRQAQAIDRADPRLEAPEHGALAAQLASFWPAGGAEA